jgi:hypothetical protein
MSEVQTSSGRSALNLRPRTLSATGKLWHESVVRLNALNRFALRPFSRLSRSTRLWLTASPSRRNLR